MLDQWQYSRLRTQRLSLISTLRSLHLMPRHGQKGWRRRMLGLISAAQRVVRSVGRSTRTSSGDGNRESITEKWDAFQKEDRTTSPTPTDSFSYQSHATSTTPTCCSLDEDQKPLSPKGTIVLELEQDDAWKVEKKEKFITPSKVSASVINQYVPCKLPEHIEQIIFETAARDSLTEALHTLVFVNHRVQKWVEYVIYESVILKNAKHAKRFLNALEQKQAAFAADAVKILALPSRVSFETSLRILTICKDIRHLSWLPVNPVADEIVNLVADLPLISLRARLSSFVGHNPDFSAPLFDSLHILFVADHQDFWKTWNWEGLTKQRDLKWLALNVDGGLETSVGWGPIQTLETTLIKPYSGRKGLRLCVCYGLNQQKMGDWWIHRSRETYSAERLAVWSLDYRINEQEWQKIINGERQDFQISEKLVAERQTTERRMQFAFHRMSL